MARTAITVSKTHEGRWSLVSDPDIPIQDQLQNFRKLLGVKVHPTLSIYRLQESDGEKREIHFITPAEQERREGVRAVVEAPKVKSEETKPAVPIESKKPKSKK